MRFVAVKSAEKQASGMVFKTDLLVRQRTQTINASRGHLTEHGIIAPQRIFLIGRLAAEVENVNSHLPVIVTNGARCCSGTSPRSTSRSHYSTSGFAPSPRDRTPPAAKCGSGASQGMGSET
jgi:hypothetical protein